MGRRNDSDDEEKYQKSLNERMERSRKERLEKKAQQENEEREARMKERLKEAHKLVPGHEVMVEDLVNNPEKNGSIGKLVEFNKAKERWTVLFGNNSTHNFKADNLKYLGEPAAADEAEDGGSIPTAKIYITNLAAETAEEHLMELFSGIGSIAREPVRNAKGSKQGYQDQWPFAIKLYKPGTAGGDAYVEFVDKCSAKAAIKTFNGRTLLGAKIGVAYGGGGHEEKPKDRERSRSRERLKALEVVKRAVYEKKALSKIFG